MKTFIFGGDDLPKTPQELARLRATAEALAPSRAPQNVGEGIASIGNALVYRALMGKADSAQKAGADAASNRFNSIVKALTGGSGAASTPAGGPGSAPTAGFVPPPEGNTAYRDAIAGIESKGSGDYAAVGPTDDKMGRALGRYQIMEANIGPWSKEVLGREITPDEFMQNPQLQDQIFDGKFGSYVQKYGPEGAAQAWFGGPGSVGKLDRQDVLGTSVGEYGNKFLANLGGATPPAMAAQPGMAATASSALGYAPQPVEVASLAPLAPDMSLRKGGDAPPAVNGQPNALRALAGLPVASGGVSPQTAPAQVAQAAPMGGGFDMNAAIELANDPYLPEGKRAVLEALVGQQLEQQKAQREMELKRSDPGYQTDLQLKRAQLNQIVNPEKVRVLTAQEKAAMGLPANLPFQMKPDGSVAQIGNAGTTVNVDTGTIPPGFRANRDEQGRVVSIEPIPGSPAAEKAAAAEKVQTNAQNSRDTFSDVITNAANRASEAYQNGDGILPTSGLLGDWAAMLPSSNASEVRRQVEVLKSNAKIENLNAMRQQSPTGGALGSVTDTESAMLAAKVGSLDPKSPNFARDLDDYEHTLLRVIHGPKAGDEIYAQTRKKPAETPKANQPVVIDGYQIEEVQ